MQTVKEFGGSGPKMSVSEFWWTSGPVLAAILLLTVIIIVWKRKFAEGIKDYIREILGLPPRKGAVRGREGRPRKGKHKTDVKEKRPWYRRKKIGDPETPNPGTIHGAATATTTTGK